MTSRALAGAVASVLALSLGGSTAPASLRNRVLPLDAVAVGVGPGGRLEAVQRPDELLPGSRVVAGTPDAARRRAAERAWLAAGRVPAVPELGGSTMVQDALLDLHALSRPGGVPVAGWSPAWRYVWPRDSALAAVALARTGHTADAEAVLVFLQRVQPPSGVFAARYRTDGRAVADDRPPQLDGVGWALWAMAGVAAELPAADRPAFVARHRRLLDRSTAAALAAVDTPSGLPSPSSDYWERPERRLTLATAALVLAGLRAAATLDASGPPARSAAADAAADRLAAAVTATFGPDGYPRSAGGSAASVDLGVDFLLPPFADRADPAVVAAWRSAPTRMLRPAGGLAPGGSWRDDGISWTNATASYALTAASVGDRETAVGWLRWLDAHRTSAGALPEKVLADGQPASVAPLSWSASAVVLAAAALGR